MSRFDPRDPVYHDVSGEKAEAAILRRFNKWLVRQPKEHQRYFCQHGSYVGHKHALAYLCEGCSK